MLKGVGDGAIGEEPNGIGDTPKGDGDPLALPPPKGEAILGPTFDDPNGVDELKGFPPPKGMLFILLGGACPNGVGAGALNIDGADDVPNGDGAGAPLPNGVVVV